MDNTTTSLITVIVPCYNQAQYLDECLQSVLDQTYENWECIIVNDGSPDNTEEVAKAWLVKDKRFRYIYQHNKGTSGAKNAGLKLAIGEWIQFLDCDDKISDDKFEKASSYFATVDLIISNYQLFNDQGLVKDYCNFVNEKLSFNSILLSWDDKFTIPIHCAIFRKCYITDHFNEELNAREDFIFWLLYMQKNPQYIILDIRQAFYRMHPNSVTKSFVYMIENETKAQEYIIKHFESANLQDFIIAILKRKTNSIIGLVERNKILSVENKKFRNSRYFRFKSRLTSIIKYFKS